MNDSHLKKLAEKQIQNKSFDEALKTIRSMDEYVQCYYWVEIILSLEKDNQSEYAMTLVEEAHSTIRDAFCVESLDSELALIGEFLARQDKFDLAKEVFRDAFHLSRRQQTFGESLFGMEKVADSAELYYENIYELINDDDLEDNLEDDWYYRSPLPELIRYMMEKKIRQQNEEVIFRFVDFTRDVITRIRKPLTQALAKIPLAEWIMPFNKNEAERIYDEIFSIIQSESQDYLENDAMDDLVASLVQIGYLDKALAFAEWIQNSWDYFWTRYEIASALMNSNQQLTAEMQIEELRNLTNTPNYFERLQALEKEGYDSAKELLEIINEMLDTFPQWISHRFHVIPSRYGR
ncbi:MAG: hypothetical protein LBI18_07120 [Planctomycetaceae bacterium]|jgi:hypothetical protein|nr:hypothetical protein [Planctomycetaceae bacterium]